MRSCLKVRQIIGKTDTIPLLTHRAVGCTTFGEIKTIGLYGKDAPQAVPRILWNCRREIFRGILSSRGKEFCRSDRDPKTKDKKRRVEGQAAKAHSVNRSRMIFYRRSKRQSAATSAVRSPWQTAARMLKHQPVLYLPCVMSPSCRSSLPSLARRAAPGGT